MPHIIANIIICEVIYTTFWVMVFENNICDIDIVIIINQKIYNHNFRFSWVMPWMQKKESLLSKVNNGGMKIKTCRSKVDEV